MRPQHCQPSLEPRKSLPPPRKRLCVCRAPETTSGRQRGRLASPRGETEAAVPKRDALQVLEHRQGGGHGQSSSPIPLSHTVKIQSQRLEREGGLEPGAACEVRTVEPLRRSKLLVLPLVLPSTHRCTLAQSVLPPAASLRAGPVTPQSKIGRGTARPGRRLTEKAGRSTLDRGVRGAKALGHRRPWCGRACRPGAQLGGRNGVEGSQMSWAGGVPVRDLDSTPQAAWDNRAGS